MSQVSLIPGLQLAWLLHRRTSVLNRGPDGLSAGSSSPTSLGDLINSPEQGSEWIAVGWTGLAGTVKIKSSLTVEIRLTGVTSAETH